MLLRAGSPFRPGLWGSPCHGAARCLLQPRLATGSRPSPAWRLPGLSRPVPQCPGVLPSCFCPKPRFPWRRGREGVRGRSCPRSGLGELPFRADLTFFLSSK